MTDHLGLAKECIAKGDEYYAQAADYIIAAIEESGQTLSHREIGERIGRSKSWVQALVQHRTSDLDEAGPFSEAAGKPNRDESGARKVLSDPEQRKHVIAALPTEQLDEIAQEATAAILDRVRAVRVERATEPTIAELVDGESFDPSETWADLHITRVWDRAHALRRHVDKWGLVLGSISEDQAYEDLQRAERDVAEVRAAMQERIRDRQHAEV